MSDIECDDVDCEGCDCVIPQPHCLVCVSSGRVHEFDDDAKQDMANTNTKRLEPKKTVFIDETNCQGWIVKKYLTPEDAKALLSTLVKEVPWIQHIIKVWGRECTQPRKTCMMGAEYSYSGSVHPQSPWHPAVKELMERINREFGTDFNGCLLNYYRDGNDYIGPHSDDEKTLAANSSVFAVSLGACRTMKFAKKASTLNPTHSVQLENGSLMAMTGPKFQRTYTHTIPKEPKALGPRISLTFRKFNIPDVKQHMI
jgi:alkylated DNA repair dioxygenase AlkB